MDEDSTEYQEEIKDETEEDDENEENYETVILKNVPMEGELSKAVIITSYNDGNSDGNLEINSDSEVVETLIVRSLSTDSLNNIQEVQEYSIDSNDQEESADETTIIEQDDSTEDEATSSRRIRRRPVDKDPNYSPESPDFSCFCGRKFKTALGLTRHKNTHADEVIEDDDPLTLQICPCCGEPKDFITHTVGDFQCTICKKLFTQKSILERHTSLEHPNESGYKCSECKYSCTDKEAFVKHLQTHSIKSVQCSCGKEFTRKYHLERHLQISGCDGTERREPQFKCTVCEKSFYRKDNLKAHAKTHVKDPKMIEKKFPCHYCEKEFQTVALLNIHERTHTGERPYECTDCPKKFPSSGALRKHQRIHTGEKPYECRHCQKRFAAKETLNRHVRTHTGDKPHSCHFCGKSFIQAAQLRAHIFHHTGENAYVCPYCSRAFNRKLRLTTHIKFMHEGAEPLSCPDCNKTFFRKEDLARHAISHTGERPFECEVCNKTFAVKSSLKIHQLTHNKEPPCSCEYCGRAFIRQDCLMRHMRARHRDILEDIMVAAEKKKLQKQLLGAITETEGQKIITETEIWNEFTLTESIKELLTILVDEDCLNELGYPDTPTDKVLDGVIRKCGHEPASENDFDYIGRMRENAKLLFTVVIDDDAVKSLLNNQTVDEVIVHVLKLAKNS